MLEFVIAVLQLYVILSIIISLSSTVFHLMPVIYSLRGAGISCYASSHPIVFTIAYVCVAFLGAPKVLFMFTDTRAYKLGLYTALKSQ
jgi:hypothetical protein